MVNWPRLWMRRAAMIYLDNNATTQILPEVRDVMMPYLDENFGNPSSVHSMGRQAREAVESARDHVAALLGASDRDEVIFTSSGTESDNWAIFAAAQANDGRGHVITTAVEHEAVRKACDRLEDNGLRVTRLSVDQSGQIDEAELESALTPETTIVSIMHANNETGVLFPIERLAEIVKGRSKVLFHSDGVNAAGKVPISLGNSAIDLYSISGHKFHAPKGVGALWKKRGVELPSIFEGGGQEHGLRPGTEAVHQIVGLGAAARSAGDLSPMDRVRSLRDLMENWILEKIPDSRLNGSKDPLMRLPNTSNVSFENTNGEAILARLDDAGICVSTGSACASTEKSVSPVLQAMDIPFSYAMGSIRISLSRYTKNEEIEELLVQLQRVVRDLREISMQE